MQSHRPAKEYIYLAWKSGVIIIWQDKGKKGESNICNARSEEKRQSDLDEASETAEVHQKIIYDCIGVESL